MFEFEPTTYEILRYVRIKAGRPAKCIDDTCGFSIGVAKMGWERTGRARGATRIGFADPMPLCITQRPHNRKAVVAFFIGLLLKASFHRSPIKKPSDAIGGLLLPDLDSNQDKQNQNLRYYRYTIGQFLRELPFSKGGYKFTTLSQLLQKRIFWGCLNIHKKR
jgi:hypothetical protein